jgi:hypothetical protein
VQRSSVADAGLPEAAVHDGKLLGQCSAAGLVGVAQHLAPGERLLERGRLGEHTITLGLERLTSTRGSVGGWRETPLANNEAKTVAPTADQWGREGQPLVPMRSVEPASPRPPRARSTCAFGSMAMPLVSLVSSEKQA